MCSTLTQYRVPRYGRAYLLLRLTLFSKVLHTTNTTRTLTKKTSPGRLTQYRNYWTPRSVKISCYCIILLCLPLILNQFSGGWLGGGTRTSSGALQRSSLGTQLSLVGPHHDANIINSSFSETSRDQPTWRGCFLCSGFPLSIL